MSNEQEPIMEPNNANAIGARVRELRHRKGFSLTELAQRANVSTSYLSTVENGTGSRPGVAILHRLAVTLGVTLADLLGRSVHAMDPGEAIRVRFESSPRVRGASPRNLIPASMSMSACGRACCPSDGSSSTTPS